MLLPPSDRGFPMKSMAPSSKALNVVSDPASVNEDTITTGIGRRRIRRSRNSRPSILGIWTSRVRTSGFNALIISRAVGASGAAPTTSISGAKPIIWLSKPRIRAESSTTRTRIFWGIYVLTTNVLIELRASASNKQLHLAFHLRYGESGLVIIFTTEQGVVMHAMQFLDEHSPGQREIVDFPRI